MNYQCIIGYGILGKKIFETTSKKNKKIKIFNRTINKLHKINSSKKFHNIDDVLKNCEIIYFLVKDHHSINHFFNVLKNKELLNNKTFVNLSTISYQNVIKLEKFVNKYNSKWIESPTLGNPEALSKKKMVFLYAGEKNQKVINFLKNMGNIKFYNKIHYPQILKIVHNNICANIMISMADAFLISKRNQIDRKSTLDMILNSGFVSPLVQNKMKKMNSGYKVSFAYQNMLKDLKIFEDSKFNYTEILSNTFNIFNKYKTNTKNKDSSIIIDKISKK